MTRPQDTTEAGWTRSTCPYCGVGCGVLMRRDGATGLEVKGDPEHPANKGRLCSKGSALAETVGLEGRLLAPRIKGVDSDWDTALDLVATRFRDTIAAHGPDSVAFYVSGQLLTEDYYVANKLMKGFIGSANIDTNSRLCMASSVAGHKRAFGTDTVPGTYEDLEDADLVVLVGSNLAWCHPVLHQRLLAARAARGTKIVVVDPRRTASCDSADLHLKLRIGSDVALFNHLLTRIEAEGALDADFLRHVEGLEPALEAARASDLAVTGLAPEEVAAFCDLWIKTRKVVTIYSQGVNQSTSGSDKVNAILNCHLATGRIGLPGSGPFSVTGQPNAMGGREVGGLANMLACHLDIENPDHRAVVQDHWAAPVMPTQAGLKAVDMFEGIHSGQIKALWVIHTNPAVSMPDASRVAEALALCPFTVVSEITDQSDTARLADVLLPAAAWGEKSGTVTNSDRTISRQRRLLPVPGAARADWRILCDVAARMGWAEAFDYTNEAEIFREYAQLSGKAAALGRDFDISAFGSLDDAAYDALSPARWPQSALRQGGRFFADGQFFRAGGKGRMLAVTHRAPATKRAPRFPFRLNTGRIRDQWHTMTRTGLSPRLSAHLAEPFVDIHPEDAAAQGISAADLVEVTSPQGRAILRARITADGQPGTVFAPIHWTGETAPSARIDQLVAPEVDPTSGQPESKASVVAVSRFAANWYGFAVSTEAPDRASLALANYWALARTPQGYRAELAGLTTPEDWEATARALFNLPEADVQILSDPRRGSTRLALMVEGRLRAALFIAPEPVAVMRDYLARLPGEVAEAVLTGRAPVDLPDPGPVLCSCFSVGVNTILTAIETGGFLSVEAVGQALQAGTNCGSCKPEIAALLARSQMKEAAE